MKIALLCLTLFGSCSLFAQNVYWSEDFAGGAVEWTEATPLCQGLFTPLSGQWALTSATHAGEPIEGLTATFSFNTLLEYTVVFRGPDQQHGFVQSRGDAFSGQLNSFLREDSLTLNGGAFEYLNDERVLRWSAQLQIDSAAYQQWGRVLIGASDPDFLLTDDGLTLLGPDAQTELFFERQTTCGRLWWWHPAGSVQPARSVTTPLTIDSPTADNGAMVINSDYLITEGGGPPPPPPHPFFFSELISPVIDLSEAEEKLSLRFRQLVRFANPAPLAPLDEYGQPLRTSFSYSLNGGESWSPPIGLNTGLEPAVGFDPTPPLNSTVMVPLPPEISGQSEVALKFIWAGDLFYWALDDIEIVSRPDHDLEIKRNFAAITPNAVTPRSQVEPVAFLADIQNNGADTAYGVQLQLAIERLPTGETVFTTDRPYGPLACDSLAENQLFDDLFDPAGLPAGDYRGRYFLQQEQPDALPADNELSWRFQLSDTTFSKDLGPTISLTAANNPSFTYGNAYYTPAGSGWYARYLSFAVDNAAQLAGQTVTTLLYRWPGDLNGDFRANPSEYGQLPVAINEYEFDGTEDTTLVTIPVSGENTGIPLDDGYHYLAMIRYQSEGGQRIFPLFTTDYHYQATWFVTDLLGQTRYAGLLALGASLSPDFNIAGFGFDLTPVVRLHIGTTPDLNEPAVSAREASLHSESVTVFPNPTAGLVTINLERWPGSRSRLLLFDAGGRLLQSREVPEGRDHFELNLTDRPPGAYRIEVRSTEAVAVKRVVVVR